jgi:HAD superfamily hydrolase (TIGR01509 family)
MPLDISRIQALCFDVDGTLSDTDDLWTSRLEKVINPLNAFIPHRNSRDLARWAVMNMESPGNTLYWLLDWLHLDDDVGRLFSLMAKIRHVRPAGVYWLIPGVQTGLESLKSRYPMAVVSARDQRSTLAFLDYFKLREIFPVIATSQTCEHTKPFADPVIWAANEMQVPAENCLMIGDTSVDIRAGKAAGAQTVGVLSGFGLKSSLQRAGADLILNSVADLTQILV